MKLQKGPLIELIGLETLGAPMKEREKLKSWLYVPSDQI